MEVEPGLQNLGSTLFWWGSLRPLDLRLPQGHLPQPFHSPAMWKRPGRGGKIQFEPLVWPLGQRWDAVKKMSGQQIIWSFYCSRMTPLLSDENRLADSALESKILKWKVFFFPFNKSKARKYRDKNKHVKCLSITQRWWLLKPCIYFCQYANILSICTF